MTASTSPTSYLEAGGAIFLGFKTSDHRLVLRQKWPPQVEVKSYFYIELSSDVTALFPEVFSPFIFLKDFSKSIYKDL